MTPKIRAHIERVIGDLEQVIRTEIRNEVIQALGGSKKNGKTTRTMTCIAPNCKNQSKGPRFRYLCEQHMNAPKKDVETWRKARKEASK